MSEATASISISPRQCGSSSDFAKVSLTNIQERAVVSIRVKGKVVNVFYPWNTAGSSSEGTGFVFGYNLVMTCAHVIHRAEQITVFRIDNKELFEAKLLFCAPQVDLAILVVKNPRFMRLITPLRFSFQHVLGAPLRLLGFPNTKGPLQCVDGKLRYVGIDLVLVSQLSFPMLVTDLASREGFSGGPVFNHEKEVIGICLQFIDDRDRSDPEKPCILSKLIPYSAFLQLFRDIVTHGFVKGIPRIGFEWDDVKFNNTRRKGIVVASIQEISPAHGKLKVGDIVKAMNGMEILEGGKLPADSTLFGEDVYDVSFKISEMLVGSLVTFFRESDRRPVTYKLPSQEDKYINSTHLPETPNRVLLKNYVCVEFRSEFLMRVPENVTKEVRNLLECMAKTQKVHTDERAVIITKRSWSNGMEYPPLCWRVLEVNDWKVLNLEHFGKLSNEFAADRFLVQGTDRISLLTDE